MPQRAVYTMGCGHDGRLGHGGENNECRPRRVTDMPESVGAPVRLALGGFHTFVVCERGVVGFGHNEKGQLGLNDRGNRQKPVVVDFFGDASGLVDLRCGAYHSVALLRDGGVYVTGGNDHGQLGLGDTQDARVFTKVTTIDALTVGAVSVGSYHTVLLGSPMPGAVVLMACGRGDFGELGYDADSWDVAANQEKRIKAQVAARHHAQTFQSASGGGYADSGSQTAEAESAKQATAYISTTLKPPPKFKVPGASTVKRRQPFHRPTFSLVKLPDACAPRLPSDEGDLGALAGVGCGDGAGVDTANMVERVCAQHLHTVFTTAGGATYEFGCYYCNKVEEVTSSIPREVPPPPPPPAQPSPAPSSEDAPARQQQQHATQWQLIHAADEVLFGVTRDGRVFALGKGNLARGEEDEFCEAWTEVPPPEGFAAWPPLASIEGTTHFVIRGVDPRHAWVVGNNYFGQLGLGDEEDRTRPVALQLPLATYRYELVDVRPGFRHTAMIVEEAAAAESDAAVAAE